jgi:hypothetical protein
LKILHLMTSSAKAVGLFNIADAVFVPPLRRLLICGSRHANRPRELLAALEITPQDSDRSVR